MESSDNTQHSEMQNETEPSFSHENMSTSDIMELMHNALNIVPLTDNSEISEQLSDNRNLNSLLPLLMSSSRGPRLFHTHCSICEQYESAIKTYVVSHAKNKQNPENQENTETIDTIYSTMNEMWLEHHIDDAIEAFTIQDERINRIEQFIQSTIDADKPPVEKASDEMISSLSVVQCEAKIDESCSICLMQFEINDEILKTKCNHSYHKICIVTWLKTNVKCPLCRCNAITGEIMDTVIE